MIGEFEAANAVYAGISECALHVSEELAFKCAFRQAAGIHGDHGLGGTRRKRMKGLGHNFFSGAMLAGNQHVGITGADAADQRQQRLHGLGFGDKHRAVLGPQQVVFRFQLLRPADHAMQINLGADD